MKRRLTWWVCVWLGGILCGLGATSDGAIHSLAERIREHIGAPRFAHSMWGIKVVSLETGRVWFECNGDKLMKPASNAKLFSAALALDRLGPEFRFRTTLYREGKLTAAGKLQGDLILYGRGDPSCAARFNDGHYELSLLPVVKAIQAAGVRRVAGNLVGDESYFRGAPFGSGWSWDDLQYYYGAQVSALTVDDNVVDLKVRPGSRIGEPCVVEGLPGGRYLIYSNQTVTVDASGRPSIDVSRAVGSPTVYVTGQLPLGGETVNDSVSVPEPARWYLILLRGALERAGVRVEGKLRTVDWRSREGRPLEVEPWGKLGEVEGRTLAEVLPKMLKPSQNLYAHLLLLEVGALRGEQDPALARRTTEEAGVSELRRWATEAGIPEGEMLLEEGSGLSRGGLVTPNAIVTLLRYAAGRPWAQLFRESLPVAGKDGTLRRRFVGTAAEGRLSAKTGTLRYVAALSGYTTSGSGEQIVFSLLLNNHRPGEGEPTAREELDTVALMLVGAGGDGG